VCLCKTIFQLIFPLQVERRRRQVEGESERAGWPAGWQESARGRAALLARAGGPL